MAAIGADPRLDLRLAEILRDTMGLRIGEAKTDVPLHISGLETLAAGRVPEGIADCVRDLEEHVSRWPGHVAAHLGLARAYRYLWIFERNFRATWARLRLQPLDIEALAITANTDTVAEKKYRMFKHLVLSLSDRADALPENIGVHEMLACWLTEVGRASEATLHHRFVLIADHDHAMSHKGLGEILLGQGAIMDGIGHLERAVTGLEGLPSERQVHGHLAAAYRQQGDVSKTLEHAFGSFAATPWPGVP